MSFPRYPEYKDSGVEWLGKVQEHWKVVPLKTVTTHKDDVLAESTAPDSEIAYVDVSSVDGINGIKAKEEIIKVKLINCSARLMDAYSKGALALQRLQQGVNQIVQVQHVQVNGQAIIGNVGGSKLKTAATS